MNHWSEYIYIWLVTPFARSIIKKYIWQKPGEWYRPIRHLA